MREYRREEVTREEIAGANNRRCTVCKAKRRVNKKEVSLLLWTVVIAAILLGGIAVPVLELEILEIPKALLVMWCTLVAGVITKVVNLGM